MTCWPESVFSSDLEPAEWIVAGGPSALLHLLGDMRGHMAGDLLGRSGAGPSLLCSCAG